MSFQTLKPRGERQAFQEPAQLASAVQNHERAYDLDIRHNARKLVAEISLKTKKNQKKFPEVVVF
jgi:hypothetical protein